MNAIKKVEKRAWGLGGKESETSGKIPIPRKLFTEFNAYASRIITGLNQTELTDIKGRESGERLLTDSGPSLPVGEHELFFARATYTDQSDKTITQVTRSITTPFLRFKDNSIVQSYSFVGGSNSAEVLNLDDLSIQTMRFGIEFFGASLFSKFVNFAPSVVATIHLELNEQEFALRTWKEVGRKIFQQSHFDSTLLALATFCQSELGETLPV